MLFEPSPRQPAIRPSKVVNSASSKANSVYLRELVEGGRRCRVCFEPNAPGTGIICHPLSLAAYFAVTDFHVPDQPGSIGQGIGLEEPRSYMPKMELLDYRTYQFFGSNNLGSDGRHRRLEESLRGAGDKHGELFTSAWRRV